MKILKMLSKKGQTSLNIYNNLKYKNKKDLLLGLFLELLQARLELALGYTPNWILSPTRLPIPPQGLAVVRFYNNGTRIIQLSLLFKPNSIILL